jgi:hypothetical protein
MTAAVPEVEPEIVIVGTDVNPVPDAVIATPVITPATPLTVPTVYVPVKDVPPPPEKASVPLE